MSDNEFTGFSSDCSPLVLDTILRSDRTECYLCSNNVHTIHKLSKQCSEKLCGNCIERQITNYYMNMPKDKWPAKCVCCNDVGGSIVDVTLIEQLCFIGELTPLEAGRFMHRQIITNNTRVERCKCRLMFRYECACKWHSGMKCAIYQATKQGISLDTIAFIRSTSKSCPKCGVQTTHWRGMDVIILGMCIYTH